MCVVHGHDRQVWVTRARVGEGDSASGTEAGEAGSIGGVGGAVGSRAQEEGDVVYYPYPYAYPCAYPYPYACAYRC